MDDTGQNGFDAKSVAHLIREGLARRRMSRSQLADAARISLSTLEKGLSAERPFTLATVVRIEDVLAIRLRGPQRAQASAELGGYRREGVDWLIGAYLTLRPSFERGDAVYAYLTEITWDDDASHLVFAESARQDAQFSQRGAVSMPYQSGHVYLVTNEHGQYRLITLSRPSIAGNMYGLLSTLRVDRGSRLTPLSGPIVLLRQSHQGQEKLSLGQISSADSVYELYRNELDRVCAEEFGVLVR